MSTIKFAKVTALPETLNPDTMYIVKSNGVCEIYVTDANGLAADKVAGDVAVVSPEIHPFMLLGAV